MRKEGTDYVKVIKINNDTYVFDAEVMHIFAYKALKAEHIKIGRDILCGVGSIVGTKIDISGQAWVDTKEYD